MEFLDNPRVEIEDHHYTVAHTALETLGLQPHLLSDTLLTSMFGIIDAHRDRVDRDCLLPDRQLAADEQLDRPRS